MKQSKFFSFAHIVVLSVFHHNRSHKRRCVTLEKELDTEKALRKGEFRNQMSIIDGLKTTIRNLEEAAEESNDNDQKLAVAESIKFSLEI